MKSILIVMFLMESVLLFGQGKISGIVVEKGSQTPIEFAGIEISGKENGKLITGATSDVSGKFTIENIPSGNYVLTCHFLGYEMTSPLQFTINNNLALNLGIFELTESSLYLDEVVVTAKKSTYVNLIRLNVFFQVSDMDSRNERSKGLDIPGKDSNHRLQDG